KPECPQHPPPGDIPAEVKRDVDDTRAHLVEEVAGTDDALTDRYLTDGELPQGALDEGLRHAVADGRIVPVFTASSAQCRGCAPLLDALVDLVPPPESHSAWSGRGETRAAGDAAAAAFVFKTRIDPHAGRLSYARVLSGAIGEGAPLVNAQTGGAEAVHLLR